MRLREVKVRDSVQLPGMNYMLTVMRSDRDPALRLVFDGGERIVAVRVAAGVGPDLLIPLENVVYMIADAEATVVPLGDTTLYGARLGDALDRTREAARGASVADVASAATTAVRAVRGEESARRKKGP